MSSFDALFDKARALNRRICLPEGDDPRVREAARRAATDGIAQVMLLGTEPADADYEVRNPATDADREVAAEALKGLQRGRNPDPDPGDPLNFALGLLRAGRVDGCVAGAEYASAHVIRNALQLIGTATPDGLLSSFFVMDHTLPHHPLKGIALFADCAVRIDPNAARLAQIALTTADSAAGLFGIRPKVALLAFSTAGSAEHPGLEKIREAADLIRKQRPSLPLLPEVQFDAAVIPEILDRKAPDLAALAPANVFIFPDLQAANIGYKIAERLGGVTATGPVLQGLARPVNDLSRGCNADDIYRLIAITALQAAA